MGASKSQNVTFKEAIAGGPAKVDFEKGIIYDVAILGEESPNVSAKAKIQGARSRRYPAAVRERRKDAFDRKPVNFEHKEGGRTILEEVGFVINPRWDAKSNKNRGDIQCFKEHRYAPLFMERADKYPETFGLSISGGGPSKVENGVEVVEDIAYINSVDIVKNPATNTSLFEDVRPMSKSLKSLLADLSKSEAVKAPAVRAMALLSESVGATEIEEDGDEKAQLSSAYAAMREAVFAESIDNSEKLKKIQLLLDAESGVSTVLNEEKKTTPATDTTGANGVSPAFMESLNRVTTALEESTRSNMVRDTLFIEQVDLKEATPAIHASLAKAKTAQEVRDIVAALPKSGRPQQFASTIFTEDRKSTGKETVESLTDYRRKKS